MVTPEYEPRLYDADGDVSKKWYIDYRIWDTDKAAFVRKRYEGMNKHHTLAKRRKVSKDKLAEINKLLAEGFTAGQTPAANIGIDPKRATLLEAISLVEKNKLGAGRSGEDYSRLRRRVDEMPAYASLPLHLVQPGHILAFMNALAEKRSLDAKAWNGYRDTLAAVFNYLFKLEAVRGNPVRGVERRLIVDSDKHQPYTHAQRKLVQAEIERINDQQLLLFISFIYYCFIRSGEELRLLRVRDILEETIRVPGGRAKNRKAEHIAIPPQMETIIARHELRSYPAEAFIFTRERVPGPVPVGPNYFSRKYTPVLKAVGLDGNNHSIYSYKHTGAINLYLASRDIELVRRHCRHAHAGITADYLRQLGAIHDGGRLGIMPDF